MTDPEPPAPPPFESAVATRRGDDGTTGLLFGGDRIPKDDLRTEAYGTIGNLAKRRYSSSLSARRGIQACGMAL